MKMNHAKVHRFLKKFREPSCHFVVYVPQTLGKICPELLHVKQKKKNYVDFAALRRYGEKNIHFQLDRIPGDVVNV